MEHERWRQQRNRDGWTERGRDEDEKTKPYLVPCGDLPADIRKLNREMIRALSSSLAEVGLKVVRTAPTEVGTSSSAQP